MIGINHGEELLQSLAHSYRAAAGTATTVRCGEGFVEVKMHHVKAHVTGATDAQQGVEIGSIVVHQSAAVMYHFYDFHYVVLKESECVRIGHHHGGYGVVKF